MSWKITKQVNHLDTVPFQVQELEMENASGPLSHSYFRLSCPDWVNILPITQDNHAVLIKQLRPGTMDYVLETPGGMVDPEERDTTMAAVRELEEETGYTSQRILPLASINPNPALFTNKCHYFVALGCYSNPDRKHFPDPEEVIEVQLTPIKDLDHLCRTGQLNHSLSALCILLAKKYINP